MVYNLEKDVIAIISDISGFDKEEITLETNLIKDLEVDSIKAIEIAVAIEKKYKVSVRDEEIPKFDSPKKIITTIADLLKQRAN